ncbi:MAG: hypothetical protein ACK5V3_11390 [Bdellovibrionales bacterium]
MKLVLLCLILSPFAWALEFTGKAYDLKSDQFLYTEKHKTQEDAQGYNTFIETEYVDNNGTLIAKIRSDFSKNKFIPDVLFEDLRNQTKETQTLDVQKNEVTIIREYLKTKQVKQRSFPVKKNMLGGQGFNNFLRSRFEELSNGKSIHVNFIVLASRDYFQFDIKQKAPPADGKIDFGLTVSSYFLKVFVKEIKTRYDVSTKRLLTFKGLSNLVDEKGNPLKVRIEYDYN